MRAIGCARGGGSVHGPRLRAQALVLAAASMLVDAAAAAPPRPKPASRTQLVDTPCSGCRASLPPGSDPVPLLVVLHGDSGAGPAEIISAWERHATSKGIAILALECPRALGCKGSWWRWDGDPAWVTAQVDALAATRAVDRERTWIAGWSGGASYIGLHAPAFQRSFAALVYHGGGIPPRGACAGEDAGRPAPVYFLVGTANPLHHLAVRLRDRHQACGDEIVWDAIPGADHGAEWRALEARGAKIADWLSKQHRAPG